MIDLSAVGRTADINIGDGRTLRYLQAGSGRPLILLHTIRTQLEYFHAVIPALARRYAVHAVDLPGHGYASIDRRANYDEPYLRSGVVAFIEKLGLRDVTLVGESIGGTLALTVAAELPQRISRVVAVNVYDYDTRYADGIRRGNGFADFILGNFAVPFHGAICAALENKLFLDRIMRGGLRHLRSMPPALLAEFDRAGRRKGYRYVERNVLANWRSWGEARKQYAKVKAPVTLAYGDGDWSTPQERRRTAEALGGVPIVTLADTGHFGFVDRPQSLAELVLAAEDGAA